MVGPPSNHADVVVVGAGAIGCASAYYLAETADRVVVLERDRLGMGASYGNAGHLTPGDAIPLAAPGVVGQALRWALRPDSPFSMSMKLRPGYVSWLIAFARWSRRSMATRIDALKGLADLSLELIQALPQADRVGFEFRQAGVLNVYQSEAGLRSGLADMEMLRRHGVPAELLDASEVRDRAAFDGPVAGGVLFPGDAQCNPYAYVRHLAAAAGERGVEFREGVELLSVGTSPSGHFTVKTSAGTFTSKAVVLAAGTAIPALTRPLRAKVPILAGGGYSVDIELAPAPRLPLLFHEHRVAVNRIDGKTRVAGLMEIGKWTSSVGARKAAYLTRTARDVFPHATTFDPGPVWAGLRPCTPDGLPIISHVPGHPNLIVAGGHAMVGMTLSTGTGRVVADMVEGKAPSVGLAPFALERF